MNGFPSKPRLVTAAVTVVSAGTILASGAIGPKVFGFWTIIPGLGSIFGA
jgi:hypothetical protein